jgi:transposase
LIKGRDQTVAKKVSVTETVTTARQAMENEKHLSPSFKVVLDAVFDLVVALSNRLGLDSSNSSKPPGQDPNRIRKTKKSKGRRRKPGAQKGHKGSFLQQVATPTESEDILVDRKTLPPGRYDHVGFESRQVFEVEVSVHVKEYRAEIVKNKNGVEFVADFPEGVTEPAQYGSSVKATAVYLSQFQLVPLDRVRDCFHDQFGLPLSKGSISHFNVLAYKKLESFEAWAKQQLTISACNNSDETGINVGGKRFWLHCLSNELVTLFHPDEKRGKDAMDRMGILPGFKGTLVHDHWKPYFRYEDCLHALCNAHHLRELERACEQDGQKWAKGMQKLLIEMKEAMECAGGAMSKKQADKFRKRYRRLLAKAEKECPLDLKSRAQSKSRNLLVRLQEFETETLRFMEDPNVPFTNNRAENDQRMTKVQQKISGCFRSMEGAKIFCRIRSYLLTCRKNGVKPSEALRILFSGGLPGFIT